MKTTSKKINSIASDLSKLKGKIVGSWQKISNEYYLEEDVEKKRILQQVQATLYNNVLDHLKTASAYVDKIQADLEETVSCLDVLTSKNSNKKKALGKIKQKK